MKRTIFALIAVLVLATAAAAEEAPSAEHGKKLFNSTSLGTNGKSCASCHPDGKGLEDAADYDQETLTKLANKCIEKALKGKTLADDSPDLSSLVMYMNTLGAAKPE